MRRRRSNLGVAASFALVSAVAPVSAAQSGSAGEGALDLLVPTGARPIGMGQAAVVMSTGTDAVWWNPALIARASRREAGYSFAQSLFAVNDNTVSLLIPVKRVGAVALTARDIDYGEQPVTDVIGPTGLLATRSLIAIATFGAPLGPVAIGMSFKVFREGFSCSGECPNAPTRPATTSAIDGGMLYAFRLGKHGVALGASVVNLGRSLQVKDAPQADPLPRRAQVGLSVTPHFAALPPDATVIFGTDVVARLNGIGTPGVRTGAELSWQQKYQLRGGYAVNAATGSGLSMGVGFNTGRLQLDLARFLTDIGARAGDPPTYLSARYQF